MKTKQRKKSKTSRGQKRTASPMTWLLPEEMAGGDTHQTLDRWHKCTRTGKRVSKTTQEIVALVEQFDLETMNVDSALLAIASVNAFKTIAGSLAPEQLNVLLSKLTGLIGRNGFERRPWLDQLLQVELPLSIASEVPAKLLATVGADPDSIAAAARREMQNVIGNYLDGDGWIKSEYMSVFGPLIACWARSFSLMKKRKLDLGPEQAFQLEWLARLYLMLIRPDKTLSGSGYLSLPANDELTRAMLAMSNDRIDQRLALICVDGEKKKLSEVPEESLISEWACAGVLRSQWKPDASRCVITFANRSLWMEVSREVNLIGGDCTPQITYNDETLSFVDEPEVLIWDHDSDGDYIELSYDLSAGVTLERQIFLAREDDFLFVADAIKAGQPGQFAYRCDFPLAPGIEGLHETETRELYLKDRKIRSLVLPLGLPEWKSGRTGGSLEYRDGTMTLTHSAQGNAFHTGLFIDLNQKRSVQPRTWRQLTVGESLKIVKPDVAVAYRVRVGEDQFVFYRSLAEKKNRSFIGYNISDGFFVGRFEFDGHVEQMLETE